MKRFRIPLLPWILLIPACLSPEEHVAKADAEVYALVEARRAELYGEDEDFTIDPPADSLRARILSGEVTRLENLGLAECMRIAAENNRTYQSRKESLYLAALDVTLERWRLGWLPNAGADGDLSGLGDRATSASAGADATLTKILGTGAEIVSGIGLSVFRDLTSGGGWNATSSFSFLITQPLLRGAGELITYEPLTQAERSLVYEVRDFERYRQQLAVDIAERLLNLHQLLDALQNEENNYDSVMLVRKRNQALAKAGRLNAIQVGQAWQNEYSSENRLIDVRQGYERQLDNFKFFLGLPLEFELELDPTELERLAQKGLAGALLDADTAVAVALENRSDFHTVVDQVVDNERKSRVSADALRLGLDIVSSVDVSSETGQPLKYNFQDVQWGIGLALDLPLDRTSQRASYRRSLISWQASARNAEEFQDDIAVTLREELRQAKSRRESFEIQANAVELAVKQVEATTMNLEAGRANTRDLLEARDDLVSSQNAQTNALIDYTLARLDLAFDMGILRVDEDGIRIDESLLPEGEAVEE